MKRGVIWVVLTCLIVTSLVLASCSTSTATGTTATTATTTTAATTTVTSATGTTATTTAATTATTTTTGNWWDSLGKPQYGGTLTIRYNKDIVNFDPFYASALVSIETAWMERMFFDNWTLDPAVFGFTGIFRPSDFVNGCLIQSYEFTAPGTLVVHVRQGIHWQNIPPANGREFVASDIASHYNRKYDPATGKFSKGGPYGGSSLMRTMISATATDKYTCVLKWDTPNPEFILEGIMISGTPENSIENPDAVALWGDLSDWHHAIGTGPFILKDFVTGSSATLVKNPDYWGYDERYPQNKLPYIDQLKILIITDDATALAALRTGKLDDLDQTSAQQAQDMKKSNPEILQIKVPCAFGLSVDPRNDTKPFNDIRVRKAMQMAIDLPTIAKTYYKGTVDPWPVALTSAYMTGWGFPYNEWPQALKDEYAYNPTAAKQLLADAGYPNGFNTDIVVDNLYDMDLLQIIKSYFAAVNINMDIRVMDYASWTSFVSGRYAHDQMSAVSTGQNLGKTTEPMIQITKFVSNMVNQFSRVNDPVYDTIYNNSVAATSIDQVKQLLSDANKRTAEQHYTISLLQPMVYCLVQPWLGGYNGQFEALYGSAGPTLLFEYPARFWINQQMKKNMGH